MLRGFDSKRVLVLIDGIRYNDLTGLSGAPFEHLMISDIERIEVVKGAQSGIWGADASAGVINIITKNAKKGLQASANAEYGSFDTRKYGANASYKDDNYYVKASVQKVETNGFSAQAPYGEDLDNYEKDGYKNITSNIQLGFNINETNKIDISHTDINAENEYDGFNNPNAQNTSVTDDTFSKINFNHIDSFNELDIYANRSVFDREYSGSEYDGDIYEYGLKSNIPYREKDFVVVGADYKSFEHKNTLDKKYNNKAAFITNSNYFGNTIITESIRYDKYDKFDNKTTGKLGVKHSFIDDLSLSANYGTSYNVPTLFNLYSSYGSENIKPENTTSYDISLEYKTIKITYFHSMIKDMIDFDMTTYKYGNITGESTLKGCEVEYKDEAIENLFFNANYTYLDAKNNDNEVLKRRAKNTVKLSLDYYGVEDLHLGLNGEYVGKRYDKDNEEGRQTGRYTLVNIVTNYDLNKNLLIYAKIDNIFDKYYQVVDGYATAERNGYVGLKAKF
jgi:vitamin B12 transporter